MGTAGNDGERRGMTDHGMGMTENGTGGVGNDW